MKKTIKISLALGFIVAGGALVAPASAEEGPVCEWAERMVMGVCDGSTTSLCKGSEQDCKKPAAELSAE